MSPMKAVRIPAYSGPDVLAFEDAPRPKPGADEVLIRVLAETARVHRMIEGKHTRGKIVLQVAA